MGCERMYLLRASRMALIPLALWGLAGCQTVRTPQEQIAKTNLPREKNMVSMPDYVVSPPDIITIEVLEALPGRPITGERLVRPDGTINLAFYGDIYVAGLTVTEIKEKIVIHLRKFLQDDILGLIGTDENDPDTEHPKQIYIEPKNSDRVFVDVSSFNSQVYYVLGDVNVEGRFPVTGDTTVLDAIENAGGLSPTAAPNNIRVVRPAPPGACCAQTLPVNLPAIMQAGDTTTNYQIMPGDRIYVYRDPIVRTTLFINRLAAPFNTVVQSILTYSFAARNVKSINVPINGGAAASTRVVVPPAASPASR